MTNAMMPPPLKALRSRDMNKTAWEKKIEVAEKRMLRWMCGVTKLDKIRNERLKGTLKVGEIAKIVPTGKEVLGCLGMASEEEGGLWKWYKGEG